MRKIEWDLIVLSHLRWDFVFQRPQHLMTRFADHHRVFFVEEPIVYDGEPRLQILARQNGVNMVQPHIPQGLSNSEKIEIQARLLDALISQQDIREYVTWYYTPMAVPFTRHLEPTATVYDSMDELSLFKGVRGIARA